MKKFISLITGGMLTAMSVMPLTINTETNVFAETTDISVASDTEKIPLVSTQATIKTDELRVFFGYDKPSYDVYVGEQIDLNSIIFNLYVYGYFPDGTFIPEPIALDYGFSIGSGEHSDCYNYYLDYVDTSKPGRYLIMCKLKGDFKETFDIKNSGCPDIPDGIYEMTMDNSNFSIPINVIDPNAEPAYSDMPAATTATTAVNPIITTKATNTIITDPISSDISAATTARTANDPVITTKATSPIVTDPTSSDIAVTTAVLPPIENEIRAMYTCQETYTVSVGEKFNPDDIELSVYARSAVPNQYQIDYKFTIGSGKHSDCFTYDAGEVDTSKPGTYYVKVTILPNVKDTYMIDSSNSCNVPEGEYEMITEGITMISMIPVYVTESAPSVSVVGDANDDGEVNLADATVILQHINNEDKYGLSAQGFVNADCNADGKVTGADAMAIQKLEAKQITQLPRTE